MLNLRMEWRALDVCRLDHDVQHKVAANRCNVFALVLASVQILDGHATHFGPIGIHETAVHWCTTARGFLILLGSARDCKA
jgi:hypothetical protein